MPKYFMSQFQEVSMSLPAWVIETIIETTVLFPLKTDPDYLSRSITKDHNIQNSQTNQ